VNIIAQEVFLQIINYSRFLKAIYFGDHSPNIKLGRIHRRL